MLPSELLLFDGKLPRMPPNHRVALGARKGVDYVLSEAAERRHSESDGRKGVKFVLRLCFNVFANEA